MSLFASGVSSFIQIRTIGPIGSGLLSIQGTSFNFLGPIIGAGLALKAGGADIQTMMAAIFGTILVASSAEILHLREPFLPSSFCLTALATHTFA